MESFIGEVNVIKLASSVVRLMVQVISVLTVTVMAFAGATTAPEATATTARDASERLNIGISLEEQKDETAVRQK
ncbi:hypothetical protein FRC0535_01876 [Corynebacterium diphtheriae]|nr:hypothetical protein FRC0535_01876 [Corynebacterium diphtheriae]